MGTRAPASLRIGVAGWDYADWEGVVYPQGARRGFDRLAYLSRFVDVIEINSTFYRPASPRTAESWARRTSARRDFRFTAKVHRSWTHETEAGPLVATTLDGLRPLLEAGRLGALLLQFPQSFHHEARSVERLQRLLEPLRGWPAVVELRHVSWETMEAAEWLGHCGVGWCLVDQPRVGRSTARPLPRVTSPVGYMRLHGRNRANWFRPDAGRDARYDYLYGERQLVELAELARGMADRCEELYIVQNNHFRGQALVNALQWMRLVGRPRPPAPEELVATYPLLEPAVAVERHRLF